MLHLSLALCWPLLITPGGTTDTTATNGVVIVTEKKLPSVLIDGDDVSKISLVTPSTGFVYSGLGPDYRVLARKSRKQAQSYYNIYREVCTSMYVCKLGVTERSFSCCLSGLLLILGGGSVGVGGRGGFGASATSDG